MEKILKAKRPGNIRGLGGGKRIGIGNLEAPYARPQWIEPNLVRATRGRKLFLKSINYNYKLIISKCWIKI